MAGEGLGDLTAEARVTHACGARECRLFPAESFLYTKEKKSLSFYTGLMSSPPMGRTGLVRPLVIFVSFHLGEKFKNQVCIKD
jgi:hypothetical protein